MPKEFFGEGLDAEVEAAVRTALKVYEKLGATLVDVSLPHSPYALAAYYLVAPAEASSNLARYDGMHYGHRTAEKARPDRAPTPKSRGEGFGKEVQRRIMLGTYALSSGYKDAYYVKALKVRRLIKNDFDEAFAAVRRDRWARRRRRRRSRSARSRTTRWRCTCPTSTRSRATWPASPGISIPCGFTKGGLPIGLQLLAPPFEEEKLLRVARMYEAATDWHTRRPAL